MTSPWTYQDVAKRLGLPVGTVYSMVCRHKIPHLRLGGRLVRFDPQAVEAWVKDRSVDVGPAERPESTQVETRRGKERP